MKFDKNIPIPPNSHGGWPKKYFFDQMDIMDSQEFPAEQYNKINSSRNRITKRTGYIFRLRRIGNKVRIWRIS